MKLKDMDKVEAWSGTGGTLLGVGPHNVTIETVEEGKSGNDNPQLELELTGEAGSIRDWIVVVPQTYGKVKSVLEAAGIAVQEGDWDFNPQSLVGKRVRIIVGEEPDYNDPSKMRRRVKAYGPPESGTNGSGSSDLPAPDDSDLPF